jgi:hypothetical protein
MISKKITNQSAFIRECVVIGLLFAFKEQVSAISKMIDFDKEKALEYQKIDLQSYFYSSIDNSFIDRKKSSAILKKINATLGKYQSSGVYKDLATEVNGELRDNTANMIYNFYVLYQLNRFALGFNFYKNCETSYIQHYVEILTDFEGCIYNHMTKIGNPEDDWDIIKKTAYNRSKELAIIFKDILPQNT